MLFRKTVVALGLSLLFLACEETPQNTEPFKQGSLWGPCYDDDTCDAGLVCKDNVCWEANDGDLLTDDLIPDEEEDDAKTDTDKVDADKVDTDKVDVDAKDEDATDDDLIVTGPCAADPCSAVEHSDGVCTADGDDYSCGCVEHYTWDGDNKLCAVDTQRADCLNIPDNAHGIGDNADGKFEQAWDGDGWEPVSFFCEWACDENFSLDEEEGECVADTRRTDCVNIPDNAHGTGDHADDKFEQTWDGAADAWLPASVVCTWECDTDYVLNEDENGCMLSTRRTDCTNIPDNAHGTGDNADDKFAQTWDGDSWEPATFVCTWACDTNYLLNGNEDGCVADTRHSTDCPNDLPDNAHWIAPNADGKFDQTWDGAADAWLPASIVCVWACDNNYNDDDENGTCVADTQDVPCTNIPDNAHGTGIYENETFEQTWNGATQEWEPALVLCTWACDENYNDDDENGTCVADTRDVPCTNIPDNAHGTGIYENDTFEQTWNGATQEWEPADETCTWVCDDNYNDDDENGTCVADTRDAPCTNIPDNAHGTGIYENDTFQQTWNGATQEWEPADEACTWVCDDNYNDDDENGTCVADTRRVDCANIPENAYGVDPNADGKFEQTWNGEDWEPTTTDICVWDCVEHYEKVDSACALRPVVYVRWDATDGENTGYSWADAFTDLSEAINYAIWGQEIWIAAGTYHPSLCPNLETCTDRERHFTVRRGMPIYGGFDGTETARDERDWAANPTILSGDFNGDDSWNAGTRTWENNSENAIHVFYHDYTIAPHLDEMAILDGVIITGGNADSTEWPHEQGGGMINWYNNSPIIVNTTFYGNSATNGGGGMFNQENSSPAVTDCIFERNVALKGSGMTNSESSNPIVTGTLFTDNGLLVTNEEGNGGAMANDSNAQPLVVDCVFDGNIASAGGAIINSAAIPVIDNCLFTGNQAKGGGAIANKSGAQTVIQDSVFYNNTAQQGGAINDKESDLTVISCTFEGNTASGYAAAVLNNLSAVTITNSVFSNNTAAQFAGAILSMYSDPIITNCTISGNHAGAYGGGIGNGESDTVLRNSIVWGNTAGVAGANVFNVPEGNAFGPYFATSNPTYAYSDIEGSGGSGAWVAAFGADGGGNIDADPLFVGSGDDPFDLQAGSPCINTGDNTLIPVGITTDILGDLRIQPETTGVVDMGAYEQ